MKKFMPYADLKAKIAEMRANGQPLNSKFEYEVWARANGDYDAVVKIRERMKKVMAELDKLPEIKLPGKLSEKMMARIKANRAKACK